MATPVVMPQMGLTTVEGLIVRWLKQEGETVQKGEPLFEVMTDKVTAEIEAPASGVLRRILAKEGETVKVAQVIAVIAAPDEDISGLLAQQGVAEAAAEAAPAAAGVAAPSAPTAPSEPAKREGGRLRISPLARRIAQQHGLTPADLATIKGSGPGGSIVKRDVLALVASRKAPEAAPAVAPTAPAVAPAAPPAQPAGKVVPLTGMRRVIAQRMAQSSHDAPQYCLRVEADVTLLEDWRQELARRAQEADLKITFTDLLVKAVALALRDCPWINVSYTEEGIIYKDEINIGIAVALEDGLIVPVVRQADRRTVGDIARERSRLVEKARAGKLTVEDVSGGTFTVSNLGMFGIDEFNAIINPPESAILAVGRVRQVPVVAEGGGLEVRRKVWLSATFDHRVIDGAQGARFLARLQRYLEDPYMLAL